jgi:hypothetical protein
MDYINGLVQLYTNADEKFDEPEMDDGSKKKNKQILPGQEKILLTIQDFASIAKGGKLNNLFLSSFAQVVNQKEVM